MNSKRGLCAVVALGGHIYAIGGKAAQSEILNTADKYDPKCNAWIPVASMKCKRAFTSAVVMDNCIYIIGGESGDETLSSVEKYDPQTGEFIQLCAQVLLMFVKILGQL